MKKISELTVLEKKELISCLERDGFINIEDHEFFLSFTKYPRDFELYRLDLNSINNDNGINIFLRESDIFNKIQRSVSLSSVLKKQKKIVEEFSKNIDFVHVRKGGQNFSEVESSSDLINYALHNPDWVIIESFDLKDSSKFITEPESTELIHARIKDKDYMIINNGEDDQFMIYSAHPSVFLKILSESLNEFLDAPNLINFMKKFL